MRLALLVFLSLAPAVVWVWFFRRQDRHELEPPRTLALAFVAGMIAVFPAALLEYPFRFAVVLNNNSAMQVFVAFIIVGLGEEGFKLLAVYVSAWRLSEFDEIADGVIYAVTAALGFAAVENLLYTASFGLSIAPARALITSFAHAAFSGIAGYHLGWARFNLHRARWYIATGLVFAALLHGIYDLLILIRVMSPLIVVVFLGGLYWLLFHRLRQAVALSPFRQH